MHTKENKILQVALVTESIVASISLSAQTWKYVSVRYPSPIYGSSNSADFTPEYLESKAWVQLSNDSFKNIVHDYSLNMLATTNKGQLLFPSRDSKIWGQNKNTCYKKNKLQNSKNY